MSEHDIESRLRAAVHAEADDVRPDEFGSLDRIRAKTATARHRRRAIASSLAAAAAIAVVVAIVPLLGDDKKGLGVGGQPDHTGTTNTTPGVDTTVTTSTPTTTSGSTAIDPADALWPAAGDGYADPAEAAVAFAADYVGVAQPVAGEVSLGTDSPTAEVPISARTESGSDIAVSTVLLAEATDGKYYVTGAEADDMTVDSPEPGGSISSPVTVSGLGQGFEAVVLVQVRDGDGTVVGNANTLGGCCEPAPYTASVDFTATGAKGAVMVFNDSAADGSVMDFTVVPVQFGDAVTTFQVFFSDGETVTAVDRSVPKTQGVLTAALTALLEGPTADERAAGLSSFFGPDTAGLLNNIVITAGTAVVDFGDLPAAIPNASSSAGSAQLLAQLDATVFQFPTVQAVEYRVNGSCDAFFAWLQMSCETRPRR